MFSITPETFKITPAMQKLRHGLLWLCPRSAVPAAGLRMPGLALHPAAGGAWTSVTLGAKKQRLERDKALQDTCNACCPVPLAALNCG